MVKLNVCIDHIAAIRQIADRNEPDPMAAAILAQIGGADGITVSWLSNSQRFQDQEFPILRQLIHTHMNLIISPSDAILQQALLLRPDMVTLVPTGYQNDGLDNEWMNTDWPETDMEGRSLELAINTLKEQNILTNILIRPSTTDVRFCSHLKSDYVHIDTSLYATASDADSELQALSELASAAKVASRFHLGVSMGRAIHYRNLPDIAGLWEVEEVMVGHAVMSKAISVGVEKAVRDFVDIIRHAPRHSEE